MKEGAARDPRNDYGEDEELHVLITGDKQDDVSQAFMPCTTDINSASLCPTAQHCKHCLPAWTLGTRGHVCNIERVHIIK